MGAVGQAGQAVRSGHSRDRVACHKSGGTAGNGEIGRCAARRTACIVWQIGSAGHMRQGLDDGKAKETEFKMLHRFSWAVVEIAADPVG